MFDPYRKWLGISAKDLPPNHYRLLGLELFESDLDVIEGAADKQMSFVRQYQSGEHAAAAAKILNELATARLCLLKPVTKAAYDDTLRQQQQQRQPAPAPKAQPKLEFPDLAFESDVPDTPTGISKKKSKGLPLPLVIGGAAVVILCVAGGVFLSMGGLKGPSPLKEKVTVAPPKTPDPATPDIKVPTEKTLKKSEILLSSKVAAEPAGPPVDLLKTVDLARDVDQGEWKQTTTAVIGSPVSRLHLPVKLPEDYQLKYRIRRLEGVDTLFLGFMMGGRPGTLVLDGWGGLASGLNLDWREANGNCTARPGRQFSGQEVADIVLTVHPRHVHVAFNNQTIIDWHGGPERLCLIYGIPSRESPFIGTSHAKYAVESAELIPVKAETTKRPARLDQEIDLLALLDMEKELPRGIWGLNKNSLTSPDSDGVNQVTFPVIVPEEYTLSTKILRPEAATGEPTVVLGLVAGQSSCRIVCRNDEALGLDLIDGRHWNNNSTRLEIPICKPGIAVKMDCTVTKQGIRVDLDGRTVIDWVGDLRRLAMEVDWSPADGRRLFLGTKSKFQFSDVKLGPPLPRPEVPKHDPITTEKPVDLLAVIDPVRDARQGTWQKVGKTLKMLGDTVHGKLVVPVDIPEEYRLTIVVAREAGPTNDEALILTLPAGRSQADLVIDGVSQVSGLVVGEAVWGANSSTYKGSVVPPGSVTELEIDVRKTGIKVSSAGKTIIDWNENPENLAVHPLHGMPGQRIGLGSFKQRFRFEKLQIRALPPTDFPQVASQPPAGNLLPLVDLARDTREGSWARKGDGIVSPAQYGDSRLRIPFAPPKSCVLEATIERLSGPDELLLGLTIGGSPCVVWFDGYGGRKASLDTLDGKGINDEVNVTTRNYTSHLLPQGKPVKIRCEVLPDRLVVRCGELEVIRWHGDPRRLGISNRYIPPNYSETDRTHFWIGSFQSAFHVHDLQMRSMTDEEEAALSGSFSGVIPTTAQWPIPLASPKKSTGPKLTITSPTETEVTKRLPVPSKSAVDAAQSRVTKAYATDIKNAQRAEAKVALAEKLQKAAASEKAPADQYALFVEAREIYMQLGDWLNAFRVADLMSADFELGRYEEKADLVQRLAKKATGAPQHRIVAIVCWKLAADAAADEDYATAKEVCQRALVASRSASESSLQSRATEQLRHYDTLLNQWKAAKAAEDALKQQPEDAEAHARIGEYLCWVRREWDEGLPSLGRTTDATLAEIVKSDLTNPVKPADRIALGGQWLSFAKSQKNTVTKSSAAVRATTWLELVVPVLESEAKSKAEAELESAYEIAYGRAFKKVLAQKPNGVEVDLTIDCNEAVYPLKLNSTFDIRKSWLLSLEFNPVNLNGGWHQIFFWGDGAGGDDPVWVRLDGNRLSAVVENTTEDRGQWIDHRLPGTAIGKWHDLKFVYDGVAGNIELYVDHKLIRRESLTVMPYADRAMPLYLGGTDPGGQRYSGQVRKVWFGNLP